MRPTSALKTPGTGIGRAAQASRRRRPGEAAVAAEEDIGGVPSATALTGRPARSTMSGTRRTGSRPTFQESLYGHLQRTSPWRMDALAGRGPAGGLRPARPVFLLVAADDPSSRPETGRGTRHGRTAGRPGAGDRRLAAVARRTPRWSRGGGQAADRLAGRRVARTVAGG